MKFIKIKNNQDIAMLFHLAETFAIEKRVDEKQPLEHDHMLRVNSNRYSIKDAIDLCCKNNPYYTIKELMNNVWSFTLHNIKSSDIGEIYVHLELDQESTNELSNHFEIEFYTI